MSVARLALERITSTVPGARAINSNFDKIKQLAIDLDTVRTAQGTDATNITALQAATADSGWASLPLTSPWTQFDATNVPVRYRKIGKMVKLEGAVHNTVAFAYPSTNVNIGTLPVGFRPSKQQQGIGHMVSSANIRLLLRLAIDTTGVVRIVGSNDWAGQPMAGATPSISAPNNGSATQMGLTFSPWFID